MNAHALPRLLAVAVAIAGGLGSATAQVATGDPKEARTDEFAEVAALEAECDASKFGPRERSAAFQARFQALADRLGNTEAGLRARLWLLRDTWWLRYGDGKEPAMHAAALERLAEILERHAKSPQLEKIVEYSYVFSTEERRKVCERLLATSPCKNVVAAAHFGLGKLGIRAKDPAEQKAARAHLQTAIDDYADVPFLATTYAAVADAYLNPISPEALAVGKPAPEITGVNEHGAPMKLSDYRGKVVLLDFWGDW